jgi:hypothetical protein
MEAHSRKRALKPLDGTCYAVTHLYNTFFRKKTWVTSYYNDAWYAMRDVNVEVQCTLDHNNIEDCRKHIPASIMCS